MPLRRAPALPPATLPSPMEDDRLQTLNNAEIAEDGRYVLYWMQQSQRASFNPALTDAVARANALGQGVIVGFGADGRLSRGERAALCLHARGPGGGAGDAAGPRDQAGGPPRRAGRRGARPVPGRPRWWSATAAICATSGAGASGWRRRRDGPSCRSKATWSCRWSGSAAKVELRGPHDPAEAEEALARLPRAGGGSCAAGLLPAARRVPANWDLRDADAVLASLKVDRSVGPGRPVSRRDVGGAAAAPRLPGRRSGRLCPTPAAIRRTRSRLISAPICISARSRRSRWRARPRRRGTRTGRRRTSTRSWRN